MDNDLNLYENKYYLYIEGKKDVYIKKNFTYTDFKLLVNKIIQKFIEGNKDNKINKNYNLSNNMFNDDKYNDITDGIYNITSSMCQIICFLNILNDYYLYKKIIDNNISLNYYEYLLIYYFFYRYKIEDVTKLKFDSTVEISYSQLNEMKFSNINTDFVIETKKSDNINNVDYYDLNNNKIDYKIDDILFSGNITKYSGSKYDLINNILSNICNINLDYLINDDVLNNNIMNNNMCICNDLTIRLINNDENDKSNIFKNIYNEYYIKQYNNNNNNKEFITIYNYLLYKKREEIYKKNNDITDLSDKLRKKLFNKDELLKITNIDFFENNICYYFVNNQIDKLSTDLIIKIKNNNNIYPYIDLNHNFVLIYNLNDENLINYIFNINNIQINNDKINSYKSLFHYYNQTKKYKKNKDLLELFNKEYDIKSCIFLSSSNSGHYFYVNYDKNYIINDNIKIEFNNDIVKNKYFLFIDGIFKTSNTYMKDYHIYINDINDKNIDNLNNLNNYNIYYPVLFYYIKKQQIIRSTQSQIIPSNNIEFTYFIKIFTNKYKDKQLEKLIYNNKDNDEIIKITNMIDNIESSIISVLKYYSKKILDSNISDKYKINNIYMLFYLLMYKIDVNTINIIYDNNDITYNTFNNKINNLLDLIFHFDLDYYMNILLNIYNYINNSNILLYDFKYSHYNDLLNNENIKPILLIIKDILCAYCKLYLNKNDI